MLIRAGFEITYRAPTATPMTLLLSVRPERTPDLVTAQRIKASGGVTLHSRPYSAIGPLAYCSPGRSPSTQISSSSIQGFPDPVVPDALQHPIADLPEDALVFLLGSRYCETDRLISAGLALFGSIPAGWPRVQAICDYVHNRIEFGYEHADRTRSGRGP